MNEALMSLAYRYRKLMSPDTLVQAAAMAIQSAGNASDADVAEMAKLDPDQAVKVSTARTQLKGLIDELNDRQKRYDLNRPK